MAPHRDNGLHTHTHSTSTEMAEEEEIERGERKGVIVLRDNNQIGQQIHVSSIHPPSPWNSNQSHSSDRGCSKNQ
jgi:hypothetical protein